jgi:hypothetical protein
MSVPCASLSSSIWEIGHAIASRSITMTFRGAVIPEDFRHDRAGGNRLEIAMQLGAVGGFPDQIQFVLQVLG